MRYAVDPKASAGTKNYMMPGVRAGLAPGELGNLQLTALARYRTVWCAAGFCQNGRARAQAGSTARCDHSTQVI